MSEIFKKITSQGLESGLRHQRPGTVPLDYVEAVVRG